MLSSILKGQTKSSSIHATNNSNTNTQNSSSETDPVPAAFSPSPENESAIASGVTEPVNTRGWRGLVDGLEENPLFSAGFGLLGVGFVLQTLRKSSVSLLSLIQRRALVSLEISSRDPSYLWVLQWMQLQQAQSPRWMSRPHKLAVETMVGGGGEERGVRFGMVPGMGDHWFLFGGRWFRATRERSTNSSSLSISSSPTSPISSSPFETISLTTLSSSRHLFPLLLSQSRELMLKAQEGKLLVYTAWGTEWRPFGKPRRKRKLESVVLDRGVRERIEGDLRSFLGRGEWYAERGIPYRRGYLLHGPPGSGKSCFIEALAGELDFNIAVLNLAERGMTDDKLNHLLANLPERCFVLFEDVDSAFLKRNAEDGSLNEDSRPITVTFSGFLNVLDGISASSSQRILFMTTNHPHLLDPALIRPGRIDVSQKIDNASPDQIRRLFLKFRPGEEGEAEEFVRRLKGETVSMAGLQGWFIRSLGEGGEGVMGEEGIERFKREERERLGRGGRREELASSTSF